MPSYPHVRPATTRLSCLPALACLQAQGVLTHHLPTTAWELFAEGGEKKEDACQKTVAAVSERVRESLTHGFLWASEQSKQAGRLALCASGCCLSNTERSRDTTAPE